MFSKSYSLPTGPYVKQRDEKCVWSFTNAAATTTARLSLTTVIYFNFNTHKLYVHINIRYARTTSILLIRAFNLFKLATLISTAVFFALVFQCIFLYKSRLFLTRFIHVTHLSDVWQSFCIKKRTIPLNLIKSH